MWNTIRAMPGVIDLTPFLFLELFIYCVKLEKFSYLITQKYLKAKITVVFISFTITVPRS
jgi:hypothetical protein